MTSKQRAALRGMGNNLEVTFQVGKDSVSQALLDGLESVINKRELIKINVLKSCPLSADEAAAEISKKLKAEVVAVTGSKVLLYRLSKSADVKHIEF